MVYMLGCDDLNLVSLLVSVSLSRFVHYKDGASKNLNKVPLHISSRRIRGDYSLSIQEQFLLRGISMVNKLAGIRNNKRFSFMFNPPNPPPKSKAYFSLRELITSCSRSNVDISVTDTPVTVVPSPSRNIPLRPDWLFCDIIRNGRDPRLASFKLNSKRMLSYEFLLDAVSGVHFIGCHHIIVTSAACKIELAVFKACSHDPTMQKYWDAIHGISAAFAGKNKIGTLCSLLAQGYFLHPEAIVLLTTKALYNSFLQLPLDYMGPL